MTKSSSTASTVSTIVRVVLCAAWIALAYLAQEAALSVLRWERRQYVHEERP